MEGDQQIENVIKQSILISEKKMEEKKQKPKQQQQRCARCRKLKKCRKHHYPLGSLRLVQICNHCYKVIKNQRNRSSKHWGLNL